MKDELHRAKVEISKHFDYMDKVENEAKKVRVCNPSSVKAFDGNNKILTYKCYPCPTCGKWIIDNENHKYCQWCGQKLDWLIENQGKEDDGK